MAATEKAGLAQSFGQPQERDFPYFRRLWNSVVVALIAASFIPLIVIGGGMYYYTVTLLERKTLDGLNEEITLHRMAIDEFLDGRIKDLKLLASNLGLNHFTRPGGIMAVFESLMRELECFTDLGVIDDQGNHLAYVGPYDLHSKNYRDAVWFQAMKDRDVYVSDVFLGFRNVPHFVIAVKQQTAEGYWILRAAVDTEYFNNMVEQVLRKRPGDAFIVNQRGIFQTRPRAAGELMGQWELKHVEPFEGVRMLKKKDEITLMAWQGKAPWVCVAKFDRKHIYGALREVRIAGATAFVLGALIILGTVLLTTNYLFMRLETKRRNIRFLDEQLRHSSRMASAMKLSGGMIRDINENLSNIDTVTTWVQELMQKDLTEEETRREIGESLNQIKGEVYRTLQTTEKFLKAIRPTMPLIQEVEVNHVLDGILDLLDREFHFNQISVTRDYQEGLPLIQSDPSQLRQVFQNLMLNAITAIQKQGVITLRTRAEKDKVLVVVEDTGPGISKQVIDKIFDPLFTAKPDGTGLGLSISAKILEKLGGRISVKSEPGEGAVFTVELPLRFRPPGA
jgi:two-component system NtrC family sensor kinase